MVRAKNYEAVSTFVKVMQKKLLVSFFRTRCTVCYLAKKKPLLYD